MFKNFLLQYFANTKSYSNSKHVALFIFALMQKRTKKIKKVQCFSTQGSPHARLDFRANALKYRDLRKLKHALSIVFQPKLDTTYYLN